MKAKALILGALCALAVALALPAGGVAATPTVTQVKGSDSGTFSICGLDLNYTSASPTSQSSRRAASPSMPASSRVCGRIPRPERRS